MTEQRRHIYFVLMFWLGALLLSLGLWVGILWGVRLVVARIAETL